MPKDKTGPSDGTEPVRCGNRFMHPAESASYIVVNFLLYGDANLMHSTVVAISVLLSKQRRPALLGLCI